MLRVTEALIFQGSMLWLREIKEDNKKRMAGNSFLIITTYLLANLPKTNGSPENQIIKQAFQNIFCYRIRVTINSYIAIAYF